MSNTKEALIRAEEAIETAQNSIRDVEEELYIPLGHPDALKRLEDIVKRNREGK